MKLLLTILLLSFLTATSQDKTQKIHFQLVDSFMVGTSTFHILYCGYPDCQVRAERNMETKAIRLSGTVNDTLQVVRMLCDLIDSGYHREAEVRRLLDLSIDFHNSIGMYNTKDGGKAYRRYIAGLRKYGYVVTKNKK